MIESRRSPSAAAGEPQITVARYPFELGRNPYQGLLYQALESDHRPLAFESQRFVGGRRDIELARVRLARFHAGSLRRRPV